MKTLFLRNVEEHIDMAQRLYALEECVEASGDILADCLQRGCKIMFCGNGGSAADSQHLAAELTGRFAKDRRPLAGIALSTDTSALTCIANDYAFDEVFSRQILGLGRPGDCLVAISTSGNSQNIVKGANTAKEIGMKVIGLLGRDGGQLRAACDVAIVVDHHVTARIQEAHILIGHTLCGLIENKLDLV